MLECLLLAPPPDRNFATLRNHVQAQRERKLRRNSKGVALTGVFAPRPHGIRPELWGVLPESVRKSCKRASVLEASALALGAAPAAREPVRDHDRMAWVWRLSALPANISSVFGDVARAREKLCSERTHRRRRSICLVGIVFPWRVGPGGLVNGPKHPAGPTQDCPRLGFSLSSLGMAPAKMTTGKLSRAQHLGGECLSSSVKI